MDKINFILDNLPDLYNKEEEGNLYNILNPIADKLDGFISDMEKVRNAKFIDFATTDDLDRISKLVNLIRFNNETDESFRGRIKSRVQTFIGGGAISALKQVVNNYLGVEPVIIEHYLPDEGHPFFDNGVLNGFIVENSGSLNITIKSGTAYISGTRITSVDTNETLSSNSTQYIKLNLNGTFTIDSTSTPTSTQISIATVITTSTVDTITDTRNILDPEQHYITNTASITVQIPYNFTSSNIPIEDVKNILRHTKAAGIALLIKIMETYNDIINANDIFIPYFIVGLSGIGGNNLLGGV